MKVHVHAFRLSPTKVPSLVDFLGSLRDDPPGAEIFNRQERLLKLGPQDGEWVRVALLTTKPGRSIFKRTVDANGKTVFTLEHLDKDTWGQAFNPMVIHVPTRIALYASQMGSCSFRAFKNYLRHVYLRRRIEMSKGMKGKALDMYTGSKLDVAVIGVQQTFEDRIKSLSQVKWVEFIWEQVALSDGDPLKFMGPSSVTSRQMERFGIDKKVTGAALVPGLVNYIANNITSSADDIVVDGKDAQGHDHHYKLSEADNALAVAYLDPELMWDAVASGVTLDDLLHIKIHDTLVDTFYSNQTVQKAVAGG